MSEPYKIGIIGCGTVGSGVIELLHRRREDLERRAGRPLEVRRIAIQDLERSRHQVLPFLSNDVEFTADVARITEADGIDLVVEVAGGVEAARDWMLAAFNHRRDVVTANKAALAFHGGTIFEAASANNRRVYYEASVAAAIPVIEIFQNGLVANQVTRISAILNGTCNYILTRMEQDGMEYAAALTLAQEKGFAEADPELDVGGGDTAHKLALLAGIVCNTYVPVERIYTEGIESITADDMRFARGMEYRIKMLAIAKRAADGSWDLRAHPTLVPENEVIAQVHNEFNAVSLRGDAVGQMLFHGKGAGALPTASSVVADILRAAENGHSSVGVPGSVVKGEASREAAAGDALRWVETADVELRHYIRVSVRDVPGVLGRITSLFGMRQISISSIHQSKARIGYPVDIVLVTHKTPDRVVDQALRDLQNANLLQAPATRIRIED